MRRLLFASLLFLPLASFAADTVSETAFTTAAGQPTFLAKDSKGNFWTSLSAVDKIARVTPGTTVTINEFDVTTASSRPWGVAIDGTDTVWFTERDGNKIGKLVLDSGDNETITEYTLPTISSEPYDIVIGPDEKIWFTELSGDRIGKLDPSNGSISEVTLDTGSAPKGIAIGPDGQLWFALSGTDKIGRLSTSATSAETFALTASTGPHRLVSDGQNALWFTGETSGVIGKITTDGTATLYSLSSGAAAPIDIARGPYGSFIWFTEKTANKIGQIAPNGTIFKEVTLATSGAQPYGLILGDDDNLWFTEANANNIAKLVPGDLLQFTNATALTAGTVGTSYSETLAATGGTTAYTFSLSDIAENSLPSGISLASNGALSGTPTSDGSKSFIVDVTDANGLVVQKGFTIEISPQIGPDLIPVVSKKRTAARKYQATVRIQNKNRTGSAAGAFSYKVYSSSDATIDGADTLLSTQNISSLAGAKFTPVRRFSFSRKSGRRYIIVVADEANAVSEVSESNNSVSLRIY